MGHRRAITIGICSLIILVLLGVLVSRYINSPAVGTVEVTASIAPTQPKVDSSMTTMIGSYASFMISAKMQPLLPESVQYPTVESFSYQYKKVGVPTWRISISINDTSHSSNSQSTSYQFRASKPSQYLLSKATVGDQVFQIMTDTGAPFSKVAYSSHGAYTADISLQGGASDQTALQEEFNALLASWQWRR